MIAVSARTRGWLLTTSAAAVVTVLVLNLLWPLPAREDEWLPGVGPVWLRDVSATGIVVAVTRDRLFDRVISRTVACTLLAGVVGLVYAVSVIGLQAVLPVGGSEFAVAARTLAPTTVALWVPQRRAQ